MHIHTIQLNIEKLLGGTIGMDATEFGAYMSLIIACYQSDNKISNEPKRLAIMARVSLKTWTRIEPIISPKFTKSDTSWSHEVVRKELVKYNSLSTKNKANILKRYNNDLPVVEARKYQKPTNTNNNKQITNNNSIIGDATPPKTPKKIKGSRLSDDWDCSTELGLWAMNEYGMTRDEVANEIYAFKDYWKAKTGANAIKLDWDATFRNWIRNNVKWSKK